VFRRPKQEGSKAQAPFWVHTEKGWTLEESAKVSAGMNGWCKRNYRSILHHFCGSLFILIFFHLWRGRTPGRLKKDSSLTVCDRYGGKEDVKRKSEETK